MLKFIRPDRERIPTDVERAPICAMIEDALVEKWLLKAKNDSPEVPLLIDESKEYNFDCGGMVRQKEPVLELEIDDWTIRTRLRHADVLQGLCRTTQTHADWLGPHVWVPGYWIKAVFTVETGARIVEWLDRELKSRVGEADQLWTEHESKMSQAGVIVPPRRVLKGQNDD